MHRSWPILLAIAALLAGCSPGSSITETITVTAPTTTPEATTPVSGSVDSGIFSSQFHPCEVFTEEQFREAGLGVRSRAMENPESVVKSCGFGLPTFNDVGGNILVATDQMDMAKTADLDLEPELWEGSTIDGIYTHQMPGQVRRCGAAIDFEWGRFLISYQEFGEGWKRNELCSLPVSVLENLITQSGGIHATQDR